MLPFTSYLFHLCQACTHPQHCCCCLHTQLTHTACLMPACLLPNHQKAATANSVQKAHPDTFLHCQQHVSLAARQPQPESHCVTGLGLGPDPRRQQQPVQAHQWAPAATDPRCPGQHQTSSTRPAAPPAAACAGTHTHTWQKALTWRPRISGMAVGTTLTSNRATQRCHTSLCVA